MEDRNYLIYTDGDFYVCKDIESGISVRGKDVNEVKFLLCDVLIAKGIIKIA